MKINFLHSPVLLGSNDPRSLVDEMITWLGRLELVKLIILLDQ